MNGINNIEDILKKVQLELDEQSDECYCSQTHGGSNISIGGGFMPKEEWEELGDDIIQLIFIQFGLTYQIGTSHTKGARLLLSAMDYDSFFNEQ